MNTFKKMAIVTGLSCISITASAHHLTPDQQAKLSSILGCLSQSNDTVHIHGCNLQITNGLGETSSNNGTGNLIIGYNNGSSAPSAPTASTSGSHNLVIGHGHTYTRSGSFIAGTNNTVHSPASFVTGSSGLAEGRNASRSTIAGGLGNKNFAFQSGILGGNSNTISDQFSHAMVILGGQHNDLDGQYSTIAGGVRNKVVKALQANILGGEDNTATVQQTVIAGGRFNTAAREAATILGGQNNTAKGFRSTIAGGAERQTTTDHEFRAGVFNSQDPYRADALNSND
ncbi:MULTISPECIES: hypothetical protein [Pseudoalteromonas]|uniref:Uncharacterized protein n=1 Tax=Pseudoalteromonas luteoviolacea (strain 2ta16) TaxID=1353533 RepID=V4JFN6_PSEL2|nr:MULTISPECIES: hypothetical protein [Pseudoalteromonas]ESP93792.1 hypothetical protein PL2TA16_02996 [Pseudoalteromonas luteoviolacea 2ta16]KZN41094.1 hypothetical protein N483_15910 [Pseudoalteromonas luteoviolacea NCIMB 1944]MCG7550760.1 hypothetical protein [Pseudoalteromonas sp. Of7M-16]